MTHPNKKNQWLTPGEFKKLSTEEQMRLVNQYKQLYINELTDERYKSKVDVY